MRVRWAFSFAGHFGSMQGRSLERLLTDEFLQRSVGRPDDSLVEYRSQHGQHVRADIGCENVGKKKLADREAMSHAATSLAKPDAAQDIAHEILAAVTGERLHPSE